jgi:uncharacterized protein
MVRASTAADDSLFAEPGLDWHPVSAKLVTERRVPVVAMAVIGLALLLIGIATATSSQGGYVPAMIGALLLAVAALGWFVVVPRMVGSWRYAEREQDLLVSHGRLVRRLAVVPYGRMQVIEVSANPLSRRLGIATVTLVTASATTDARIPGLPVDTAQRLRDRLAAKGEAMTAGL